MKYPRYKGEFVSISGDVYRCEIWQENDAAFPIIGDLTFDAETPVQIEWGEKAKEEVIQGSTCTIRVESPGDRTYEDLYTIEPGRIRLDVYRNETLYWSGGIDTEFYEEPYEAACRYIVPISFSDFGILKRVKYSMQGMQSIAEILRTCLKKSDIKYIMLDTHMISTSLYADGRQMRLNDIKVRSENFYDEDGEASTLYDALEGIMQPLGMKLIQKNGKICVYDLNGMYWRAGTEDIEWSGDSQTLSVDRVYNNVKITWSTYAQSGNMLPEKAWGFVKTDANLTALNEQYGIKTEDGKATYFSYSVTREPEMWTDEGKCGFTAWMSKEGINAEIGTNVHFFKIVPQNDGTESEGVVLRWASAIRKTNGTQFWVAPTMFGTINSEEFYITGRPRHMLMRSKPIGIPSVENPMGLLLKLKQEMMMDWRINPYEEGIVNDIYRDEVTWMKMANTKMNFVYVPVVITFKAYGSNNMYVWDNRDAVTKPVEQPVIAVGETLGQWVPYSETDGMPNAWGYMAFYDMDDRTEKCGILGWKHNMPGINPYVGEPSSMLKLSKDGQFITYPGMEGKGGEIRVAVYDGGWKMWDGGRTLTDEVYNPDNMWQAVTWLMLKLPQIEILNNYKFDKEINTDDVEYSSTLNDAAEEGLDIDTMCGTAKNGVPTARGAYFNAETNEQITTLTREHRTTQAEELLMGTLYSQYADRHTKLSGVAKLLCTDICAYTDRNQPGKKFICVSDVEDVRMNDSDAVFIELSRDEYKNQEGV